MRQKGCGKLMNYPLICTEGRNDENKHGNCSTTNAGGNGDVCLKKKKCKVESPGKQYSDYKYCKIE